MITSVDSISIYFNLDIPLYRPVVAQNGERSVLTLGALCLPCCVRGTE